MKASPFHALIVKHMKIKWSLLCLLRKRRPPQHIKHIRNTRISRISTFDEPCSSTLHPLNFVTVVFLVWVPNSGAILHKRANQRKVSSLLKLLWAALQVATQKRKLGVSLVCHCCNVFRPLQVDWIHYSALNKFLPNWILAL